MCFHWLKSRKVNACFYFNLWQNEVIVHLLLAQSVYKSLLQKNIAHAQGFVKHGIL